MYSSGAYYQWLVLMCTKIPRFVVMRTQRNPIVCVGLILSILNVSLAIISFRDVPTRVRIYPSSQNSLESWPYSYL